MICKSWRSIRFLQFTELRAFSNKIQQYTAPSELEVIKYNPISIYLLYNREKGFIELFIA